MKIAMINNGCSHAQDRFWGFLQYGDAHYYHVPEDFIEGDYTLIFVEASCKIDVSGKIGGAKVILFDCEDDPSHWEPGLSFFALKDTALAYGKLVINEGMPVSDLKEIMLPVAPYLWFNQISQAPRPLKQNYNPFFRGVGSFIGKYNNKYKNSNLTLSDNPIGDTRFLGVASDGNWVYSQRYQWLMQFEEADIKGDLGIVWGESNQSLEWQTEHFGNVSRFGVERISYDESIRRTLSNNSICLPTGYCRWSFRNYDAIACGSVMFSTDYGKKRMLYEPIVYEKIEDYKNIVDAYNKELKAEDFRENREILKNLTPEKIWNKFVKQLN
jgi:hypothetical protein